jgi:hypothetical protein
MSTMSLRLPESLHEKAREMAEREGISINQLVATALAEKLAALMTVDYLQERASRNTVDLTQGADYIAVQRILKQRGIWHGPWRCSPRVFG